ncbi:hypothetical protein MRX96_035020 [Rhipicephalus microplus]
MIEERIVVICNIPPKNEQYPPHVEEGSKTCLHSPRVMRVGLCSGSSVPPRSDRSAGSGGSPAKQPTLAETHGCCRLSPRLMELVAGPGRQIGPADEDSSVKGNRLK